MRRNGWVRPVKKRLDDGLSSTGPGARWVVKKGKRNLSLLAYTLQAAMELLQLDR